MSSRGLGCGVFNREGDHRQDLGSIPSTGVLFAHGFFFIEWPWSILFLFILISVDGFGHVLAALQLIVWNEDSMVYRWPRRRVSEPGGANLRPWDPPEGAIDR